jgi:uncharacterized membrane protein YkoI
MRRVFGLTAMIGALALGGCKGGGHEVKTSMDAVPAPVKATLEREAAGGKVTEIEQETKGGKTVYSADVTDKAGKKWDVVVGADGKVISKEKD